MQARVEWTPSLERIRAETRARRERMGFYRTGRKARVIYTEPVGPFPRLREVDWRRIKAATCDEFGLRLEEIEDTRVWGYLTLPRHAASYLLREAGLTYRDIALALNRTDLSTSAASVRRAHLFLKENPAFGDKIYRVRARVWGWKP